jgi:hypothetical protein
MAEGESGMTMKGIAIITASLTAAGVFVAVLNVLIAGESSTTVSPTTGACSSVINGSSNNTKIDCSKVVHHTKNSTKVDQSSYNSQSSYGNNSPNINNSSGVNIGR